MTRRALPIELAQDTEPSRGAIPWDDPSIESLSREERREVALSWSGRASGELHTAGTFALVHAALRSVGAPEHVSALAERAVLDEQRHAELCRRVASRYAGEAVPAPVLGEIPVPAHSDAPRELLPTLYIVGQCCLNETTATAYLEACLSLATAPLVRAVLREFLSDEIDHARIGWAHLSTVCRRPEGRAALTAWLPTMLALNTRRWRGAAAASSASLAAHGCPSGQQIDAAVRDAVETLILPGFAQAGVDVTAARAWWERSRAE